MGVWDMCEGVCVCVRGWVKVYVCVCGTCVRVCGVCVNVSSCQLSPQKTRGRNITRAQAGTLVKPW